MAQQDASALTKDADANAQTIGICLIGNAEAKPFDGEQLRELIWLVKQLQARYHIPAEQLDVKVGNRNQNVRKNGGIFPIGMVQGRRNQVMLKPDNPKEKSRHWPGFSFKNPEYAGAPAWSEASNPRRTE